MLRSARRRPALRAGAKGADFAFDVHDVDDVADHDRAASMGSDARAPRNLPSVIDSQCTNPSKSPTTIASPCTPISPTQRYFSPSCFHSELPVRRSRAQMLESASPA